MLTEELILLNVSLSLYSFSGDKSGKTRIGLLAGKLFMRYKRQVTIWPILIIIGGFIMELLQISFWGVRRSFLHIKISVKTYLVYFIWYFISNDKSDIH